MKIKLCKGITTRMRRLLNVYAKKTDRKITKIDRHINTKKQKIKQKLLDCTRPLWYPYTHWRSHQPPYKQRFSDCFLLTVAIAIFVHIFPNAPMLADWERWVKDKTIILTQVYYNYGILKRPTPPANISNYVLVDIDDTTWQNTRWGGGEPFLQPRAQLRLLIDKAFAHGACVVYLDIFTDGAAQTGDIDWLRQLSQKTYPKNPTCQQRHLLVARSIRTNANPASAHHQRRELRPAFWDTYTTLQKNQQGIRIHSVVPSFPRDDDFRIRHWHIKKTAYKPDKSGYAVYHSPQLAMYCIQSTWQAGKTNPALAAACQNPNPPTPTKAAQKAAAQPTHRTTLASTILFPFPAKNSTLLFSTGGNRGYHTFLGLEVLQTDIPIAEFNRAVVVIGASFQESRDFHNTPVGVMSGSVLSLNAIDTLLRHGQIKPLAWYHNIALTLALIIAVSAIFAIKNSIIANTISTWLLFGVFPFVLGPVLLLHGWWFKFGSIIGGAKVYSLLRDYKDNHQPERQTAQTHKQPPSPKQT